MRHELLSKDELVGRFGFVEYLVFVAMLLVSLLIGVFFWFKSRKQDDNVNFLLGGKNMGLLPMTLSLIASFMSAITLLGVPAEMYSFGTMLAYITMAYPAAILLTSKLFMPVFVNLGVTTSYEYLEWRFNLATRVLVSALFNIHMVLYMAIVVYAPALAVAQITGMSVDLACVAIFGVCIIYTAMGGIKAVMWTDVFQTLVMFGSFLVIIVLGNHEAGGFAQVFKDNYENGRIELFNFDLSPFTRHTVWSVFLSNFVTWSAIYGVNQTMVQRYLTVSSLKKATKALWINVLGITLLFFLCAYSGLIIFAYYHQAGCDPIQSGQVSTKDQLFPLFIMQVVGTVPLIPGLFVAGVFSGALSTVSSGLNALAGVAVQDFVVGGVGKELGANTATIVTKVLAVAYGIVALFVVYLVKMMPAISEAALAIHGTVNGPILGAFLLGVLVPFANAKGAFWGTISGFLTASWIAFGQTMSKRQGLSSSPTLNATIEFCPQEWLDEVEVAEVDPEQAWFPHFFIYEISYVWLSVIGVTSCLLVGVLVSLVTGVQDASKLNPMLVSPVIRNRVGANFVWSEKERRLQNLQLTETKQPESPTKFGLQQVDQMWSK